MRSSTSLIVAATTVVAVACSSSYTPKQRGRVALVMEGGQVAYYRDGRTIKNGFTGGGLAEAVRGVPEAERMADSYRRRITGGFMASIAGVVCATVGVGFAVASAADDDGDNVNAPALGVAGACTLLYFGGLAAMISATPMPFDAVNIYNDQIDDRLPDGEETEPGDPWLNPDSPGSPAQPPPAAPPASGPAPAPEAPPPVTAPETPPPSDEQPGPAPAPN